MAAKLSMKIIDMTAGCCNVMKQVPFHTALNHKTEYWFFILDSMNLNRVHSKNITYMLNICEVALTLLPQNRSGNSEWGIHNHKIVCCSMIPNDLKTCDKLWIVMNIIIFQAFGHLSFNIIWLEWALYMSKHAVHSCSDPICTTYQMPIWEEKTSVMCHHIL